MRFRFNFKAGAAISLALVLLSARADTLALKNGSLIKGKYVGGTEAEIRFQVGSTLQTFSVNDVQSIRFDSENAADTSLRPSHNSLPDDPGSTATSEAMPAYLTVPAGTRISVRTVDAIDSSRSFPGDRFQASLVEPLLLDGKVLVERDALVYGQLTDAKGSGTFTGRSQLRLVLTGIAVNGKMVAVDTGDYDVVGKSRGASTAKRTVGGAAIGAIIGAAVDGGQGAAIGAGVGAGAGAGSEIILRGDQVKIPSETLLDFTLLQDMFIPRRPN